MLLQSARALPRKQAHIVREDNNFILVDRSIVVAAEVERCFDANKALLATASAPCPLIPIQQLIGFALALWLMTCSIVIATDLRTDAFRSCGIPT